MVLSNDGHGELSRRRINDGHGELSRRRINDGLTRGALVHCGFDNDAGGNKLWQQVKGAYPRAGAWPRSWR